VDLIVPKTISMGHLSEILNSEDKPIIIKIVDELPHTEDMFTIGETP